MIKTIALIVAAAVGVDRSALWDSAPYGISRRSESGAIRMAPSAPSAPSASASFANFKGSELLKPDAPGFNNSDPLNALKR